MCILVIASDVIFVIFCSQTPLGTTVMEIQLHLLKTSSANFVWLHNWASSVNANLKCAVRKFLTATKTWALKRGTLMRIFAVEPIYSLTVPMQ